MRFSFQLIHLLATVRLYIECVVWLLVYGFVNIENATIREFVELYTVKRKRSYENH